MQESLNSALCRPEPSPRPLTTAAIGTFEELTALEPAWWDLWRRTPSATPFQSPAWLIAWRQAFAPGPLRVGAVFDEARLVALFPFYAEEPGRHPRLMPL